MPRTPTQKRRATCYKLIFMGLAWSGFVFFLEYLALQDADAIDYTSDPSLGSLVWLVKGGGIAVALIALVMLMRTFKREPSDQTMNSKQA